MVCAENKYEARLHDEENTWSKPTEEQEKIVAMSTEINSLKKQRGGTACKTNKPKQAVKKQAPKKAASKKPTDKKKRPMTSGPEKTSPQRNWTPKKMRLKLKLLKLKSIFGVRIIAMEQECGPYTTQKTVRAAQGPTKQRPMLTSLPLTW